MSAQDHREVDEEGTVDLAVTNLTQGTASVERSTSGLLSADQVREATLGLPALVHTDATVSPIAPKRIVPAYTYAATVQRWVDGDTCDVVLDLGFKVQLEQRVRLLGLDTPERGHELHHVAADRARALAPEGSEVTLRSHKPYADDKYGRYLAQVQSPLCEDVTTTMIAEGLGRPYDGGTKDQW